MNKIVVGKNNVRQLVFLATKSNNATPYRRIQAKLQLTHGIFINDNFVQILSPTLTPKSNVVQFFTANILVSFIAQNRHKTQFFLTWRLFCQQRNGYKLRRTVPQRTSSWTGNHDFVESVFSLPITIFDKLTPFLTEIRYQATKIYMQFLFS